MKLNIDWKGLLGAVVKAAWPFIAGAVGGVFAGCTVGGIGPNFFTGGARRPDGHALHAGRENAPWGKQNAP
jgi:hypothetical protein